MIRNILAALGLTVLLLFLAGNGAGQENESDAKESAARNKSSIAGLWRAESAAILSDDGTSQTLGDAGRPCNATISDTHFTLRLGANVIVDMDYVLDTKSVPWTIDLRSKDGTLLGLCSRTGEEMKIVLNDADKGRPADFDAKTHGMTLSLWKYRPAALYVINADGSGLKPILASKEFTFVGSPDWSRDGRRITFNGWRSLCGERHPQAHVLVCNADGSGFKDLGMGAIPSWSPDGHQITFTSTGPERGICLMNADGSNRRSLNIQCWGSHWSPTRNEIACSASDDNGANLIVYDVAKEERRSLLDRSYQRIYWGVAWSPNGDWICFKGLLPDGGAEIAAVSVQGEKKGFKVLLPVSAAPEVNNCNSTMAWGGSGNQILVAMQKGADSVKRLYALDFQGEHSPQLFSGYPANWGNVDAAWSPDLKKVILAAKPAPEPAPQ